MKFIKKSEATSVDDRDVELRLLKSLLNDEISDKHKIVVDNHIFRKYIDKVARVDPDNVLKEYMANKTWLD